MVKKKLGVEPPPKVLVENYLIEIAKNFNIPYNPDRSVMIVNYLILIVGEKCNFYIFFNLGKLSKVDKWTRI